MDVRRRAQLSRSTAAAVVVGLLAAAAPAQAVIGGTRTDADELPYLADLGDCGGALIAPARVLTAAHCVTDMPTKARVRVGPDRVRRRAARVAQHPAAARALATARDPDAVVPFDAAIIALDRPVRGVPRLRLARAADARRWRAGSPVVTVGRGSTNYAGDGTGPLRAARVATRSDRYCRRAFGRFGRGADYVAERTLCTTDPDGRRPYRSSCYGDSGNPLIAFDAERRPLHVGIDSWGVACGERGGDPEAYTETAAIRRFALARRPAWRPRALGRPGLRGPARPNGRLTCVAPRFARGTRPSRIHYRFDVDGKSSGERASARFRVPRRARGKEISCTVRALSEGGAETSRPARARVVRDRDRRR